MVAIHDAIEADDIHAVEKIIGSDKSQLEARSRLNDTPLHHATRRLQMDTVRLLLAEGANVNAIGNQGYTALHYVAQEDEPQLAALLLNHGANPNMVDNQGVTPLDWACRAAPSVAQLLIQQGAKVDLNCAIRLQDHETVHRLLSMGGDLQSAARFPHQVLEDAIHVRNADLVDSLLSYSDHPNPLELADDKSLMFRAIEQSMSDCDTTFLRKLLEAGAKTDVANQRGQSPLQFLNQFHATRTGSPSQADTKQVLARLLKHYGAKG